MSLFVCGLANADEQPPPSAAPDKTSASAAPAHPAALDDEGWHINLTGYIWFAGVHGNVGGFGHDIGFKASPGDLLSHADFGLMGITGVQYKKFVSVIDFVWAPITTTQTRTIRLPSEPQLSAKVKYTQTILTPEFGYRVIDSEKVKIDGITGFRYWHQGTTLTFTPTLTGNNYYKSLNYVDPLVGGRIQVPLSPKILATVMGDVGGWGAGSQLDYQIIGALSYRIKPKWALDAAWRYLYVDYAKTYISTQTAESGFVLGVTYALK